MKSGFTNLPYEGASSDGRNWTSRKALYFVDRKGNRYCVLRGATTDGPSIPHQVWNLMSPVGRKWLAGVLHDAAYRHQLAIWNVAKERWDPISLTKAQCDRLLYEGLRAHGVGRIEANVIYYAVKFFGGSAFRQDRKERPEPPTRYQCAMQDLVFEV